MTAVICSLCVLLLALSIACRAMHEYIRHDLEQLCIQNNRREHFGKIVKHYEAVRTGFEMLRSFLLFSVPVLITLTVLGIPLNGHEKSVHLELSQLVNTLPYFFLFVACRYWISRPIGDLWATKIVYHFFSVFRVLSWIARPLQLIGKLIEIIILRLAGKPKTEQDEEEDLEDDILSMVAEGHREGLIEDEVHNMLNRIMRLDEIRVSAIMTQRSNIQYLPIDATWQEMLETVKGSQFSRIPVYGKTHDEIVGILFSKDLLMDINEDGVCVTSQWKKSLRKPYLALETKPVHILLREFLKTQNHFAIVLDEYGNVAGVVTLEDILEQIVGEIADETDDKPIEEVQNFKNGAAEVLGRASVAEVNSMLGTEFPTDGDYDSIGGLILSKLGKVPEVGETVKEGAWTLTIVEATNYRIDKVKISAGETVPENNGVENELK